MSATLYERDFYTWTQQQSELLRTGRWDELDTSHLIEELDSMGARERRELGNRLAVLLAHLLKWQYQPDRRGNSWRRTIKIQRIEINEILADNPGLKSELTEIFAKAYEKARILAADETRFDEDVFPAEPCFSLAASLDAGFWPGAAT
ncbi:protein of unknown function DUF29 [Methylomagnum ishizawai]|uniref:DUF29 domain-containing protein n=1 Tax=Methylomagnum ishizawai TaxID=1760988 RepID=A0A1Y6CV87_9GAMM|nr:DUF29 domain-containing protein [Methylomagnum ishizawai]SMF94130.1 protein of unknown function DUF29 [Methylomagnum ishizawai]